MKYETKLRFIDDDKTFESVVELSLKELFHTGTRVIRMARRHGYQVRFVVRDYLTGERLLVFFCRKRQLGKGYVCRLSRFCKYGRTTGLFF